MTGDEYIFIAFLLKFHQELRTAGFHAGSSLDCFRCREYFRQGPVESHSRSEKKVFLLLVFAKIDLNDPGIYNDIGGVNTSHDSTGFNSAVERTCVDRVEGDISYLRTCLSCLSDSGLIQGLICQSLH